MSEMDQPSSSTIKSGLPRPSRLPLPRAIDRSNDPRTPIKDKSKSRTALGTKPQDALNLIGSARLKPTTAAVTQQPAANALAKEQNEPFEKEAAIPTNSKAHTLPRRPRPSLSDRTIETLSQIPPSPSPRRRRSSFFPPESPSNPPSRPGSSLNRSRPSTSHGRHPPLPSAFPTPRPPSPIKRDPAATNGHLTVNGTPSRRSTSSYVPKSLPPSTTRSHGATDSTPSKLKPLVPSTPHWPHEPSSGTGLQSTQRPVRGSKTLAARLPKQRPSIQGAFTKPPQKVNGLATRMSVKVPRAGSPTFSTESSDAFPAFSPRSKRSSRSSSDSGEPSSSIPQVSESAKAPKSSATLRETIAKAKAARREASEVHGNAASRLNGEPDSFPDSEAGGASGGLLQKRVATARIDGRLNIAALGLREIPAEVMNMYSTNIGDGAWYESVDLIRLIAADNEFEQSTDLAFPDQPVGSHDDDNDYQGNLFAGLETLDLHGNQLRNIPVGLRRLEHLATLNLSKNRLGNGSLQVIGQILSLRELRLAENAVNALSDIFTLQSLEVLDLHSNLITDLPNEFQYLSSLRILNVSENRMSSLPFECLDSLVELDAAQNRLRGSLLPAGLELPNLRTLDVAHNALTSLTDSNIVNLPSLQFLNITENRLTDLPDVSSWTELLTLTAGGNRLSKIPEGLSTLTRLKTVDFTRNDIRKLDERIGLMDNLAVLRVANNPLRERRYLTMETGDLKRDLRARLLPEDRADDVSGELLEFDAAGLVPNGSAAHSRAWPMKPGGILDRSSTKMETLDASDLEPLIAVGDIKSLVLHHNFLPTIPQAIRLVAHSLTSLNVSNNKLAQSNYRSEEISLPNLRSLDLSVNAISTLLPLINLLSAPRLTELNVSRNRLATLLPLRDTFPSLTSLFAADNSICVLEVEVVKGLEILDISGNEIDHLEPRLGLLGTEGLRTLVVGGNRFRVPRRDIVDKGTGAVLTWLRSRIPEEEQ